MCIRDSSSTGPELPYHISTSAMSTSPDGKGVVLFAGAAYSGGNHQLDSIIELKADDQGWIGSWTTLETKLQYARHAHVVIPVFMDIDICGINGIFATTTCK